MKKKETPCSEIQKGGAVQNGNGGIETGISLMSAKIPVCDSLAKKKKVISLFIACQVTNSDKVGIPDDMIIHKNDIHICVTLMNICPTNCNFFQINAVTFFKIINVAFQARRFHIDFIFLIFNSRRRNSNLRNRHVIIEQVRYVFACDSLADIVEKMFFLRKKSVTRTRISSDRTILNRRDRPTEL